MKKGQKKRVWTPEQKSEIVHKHLDDHISVKKLEKEYQVEHSTICRWTKEYLQGGESVFEPKPRLGNKFAALHRSKNLSELDRLRLLVEKQEIEIARLKKGYWVEGVGVNRVYVTGQEVNTKLSKNERKNIQLSSYVNSWESASPATTNGSIVREH